MRASGTSTGWIRTDDVRTIGHWAVAADADRSVQAWDLASDSPAPRTLARGSADVVSASDRFVVILQESGDNAVWDLASGVPTQVTLPITVDIEDALSDRWLAFRGKDGMTYLADLVHPRAAPLVVGPSTSPAGPRLWWIWHSSHRRSTRWATSTRTPGSS